MSNTTNGRRKDSEVQAAEGSPDPELESLIAPQGYDAELVDAVATMETPQQQRGSAIRFLVVMLILVAIGYWFCTPADLVVPEFVSAPYNIHQRPLPPANKFLEDAVEPMEIIRIWSSTFLQRTGDIAPPEAPFITYKETEKFYVFGMTTELPKMITSRSEDSALRGL